MEGVLPPLPAAFSLAQCLPEWISLNLTRSSPPLLHLPLPLPLSPSSSHDSCLLALDRAVSLSPPALAPRPPSPPTRFQRSGMLSRRAHLVCVGWGGRRGWVVVWVGGWVGRWEGVSPPSPADSSLPGEASDAGSCGPKGGHYLSPFLFFYVWIAVQSLALTRTPNPPPP